MFYAYIFLGAGILILSILFRLAAVFRLSLIHISEPTRP